MRIYADSFLASSDVITGMNLSMALVDNGSICIAHGASREVIDGCHADGACHVSRGLPSDQEFLELLEKDFVIKTFISDERMIELIGIKK